MRSGLHFTQLDFQLPTIGIIDNPKFVINPFAPAYEVDYRRPS